MTETTTSEYILLLGSALAIGLLIGMERGWRAREAGEGQRIAGLRTYGLFGLLGGATGLLARFLEASILGFIFVGFAITVTTTYLVQRRHSGDIGITSLVAALLTFVLGAIATLGYTTVASSAAVVTALLLGFKETLHNWLRRLEQQELYGTLQLLLISVVVLPVLPDKGYGPWGVLNPYQIWWMVVLVAAISFSGYIAMKIAGTEKGVLLTGLFAGFASSTAVTLHLSRLARRQPGMEPLLAAGILVACGTMFPRVLLVAVIINPALLAVLAPAMMVMAALSYLAAVLFWWRGGRRQTAAAAPLRNPLELRVALLFGALLAVILLLGEVFREYFGAAGLYALAAFSGVADVDAINLTLSRMSLDGLLPDAAMLGIVIATASNTFVKAVLATAIGGRALATRVLPPLFIAALVGLLVAWLL
ncbi:MAG: MgtC/SapB family protein [Gammaproteobacteria bacterium]